MLYVMTLTMLAASFTPQFDAATKTFARFWCGLGMVAALYDMRPRHG